MRNILCVILVFLLVSISPVSVMADEEVPQMPKLYLNGKETTPTVQDLSGILTRPLRLLVEKNNAASGFELMQVYAMGAREGDDLHMDFEVREPGMRLTVYKILREPDGVRYLNMPLSVYYDKSGQSSHEEKIPPSRSEYFIIAFEKTNSLEEKNAHVRYFEERAEKLVIASLQTNIMLSSLKFKMKNLEDDQVHDFLQSDAQELVDRLINPKRIFIIRVWKDETKKEADIAVSEEKKTDSPLDKIME